MTSTVTIRELMTSRAVNESKYLSVATFVLFIFLLCVFVWRGGGVVY